MKKIKSIVPIFLSFLIIFVLNGCLPNNNELQVLLLEHNIPKKVYIKNDTNVYDGYKEDRKVIQTLQRADEYEVIDIKNNFLRLAKTKTNKLKTDVWIGIDEVEAIPTYFVTLTVDAPNAKVTLARKDYELSNRLPNGTYKIDISAPRYLDKTIELEVSKDTKEQITLDFDEELERKRLEKIRLEKERIRKEKIRKEKIRLKKEQIKKEILENTFRDKEQKLMWQDNIATMLVKKEWLTKTNFDAKNYNDTQGDTATTYCNNLKLAGFTDWRLPTKDELKNLTTKNEKLKNTSTNWYWSSTTSENHDDRAWSIYFNNGDGYTDMKNNSNHIRCVRVEK